MPFLLKNIFIQYLKLFVAIVSSVYNYMTNFLLIIYFLHKNYD